MKRKKKNFMPKDDPPFGVETISTNYRTHKMINFLFKRLSDEKNMFLYEYYNIFCIKYLEKEISELEDKNTIADLLNKLKKIPKIEVQQ